MDHTNLVKHGEEPDGLLDLLPLVLQPLAEGAQLVLEIPHQGGGLKGHQGRPARSGRLLRQAVDLFQNILPSTNVFLGETEQRMVNG